MIENIILQRITDLIQSNKITPNKLLVSCNLQSNAYTKWKNGIANPSLDALIKIANYFNVSIDYLVGRETPAMINADVDQAQKNITYDATTAPLLDKWGQLTQIQKEKTLSYIDAMIDDTPDFIKGEMIGRQNANRRKNNSLNIESKA